jgi:transposase
MKREALGRSRGGLTTKIHIACDGNGIPLSVAVSPGQTHDSTCFETTVEAVPLDWWPDAIAGDKGYSAGRIRAWLEAREIGDVIPYKEHEHRPEDHVFDREAYRRRNVIERLIGWLKECRRIATRFEKRAKNFLGMVTIAVMRRLVKLGA